MKKTYMAVLLVALSLVSLFIGVGELSLAALLRFDPEQWELLRISRIPRLISILIAGVSMSIVGLIMQQLTRNKFVSPTTAGTMDSASFGIMVSLLVFTTAGPLVKMSVAFGFALLGTYLFMAILNRVKYKDAIFIPLVGLMFGGIVESATTFFAYKYNLIQSMSAWLYGDFSMIMQGRYELLYISVPLVVLSYVYANKFTVAGMGEEFSVNLGLNYKQVVNIGLGLVALVTAVVVLTVGSIPFLGLIIPNLVTMFRGDNLKDNLTHTALLGAVFVLACDILGRVIIYPYEISIGLTVGVVGSGIFLYLLMRRRTYES
ncbi:Iron-uptake system permease protein FeuB [compost metagenome]|uniref:ABC transporter permease n=1 Tax=Paenibacillus rhizolycopersici TaxID=2780073 RepID=A0ABS2HDR0_9BACL|nr:ABC transporter permease [Paenibacillus rhizolycopersici]MBM6998025.1 ABC transporter permease [Paenibacillus rhizolycopersici]